MANSGYIFFVREHRPAIIEKIWKEKGYAKFSEVSIETAKAWSNLDDTEKMKYRDMEQATAIVEEKASEKRKREKAISRYLRSMPHRKPQPPPKIIHEGRRNPKRHPEPRRNPKRECRE
jgi:hypothetical protein